MKLSLGAGYSHEPGWTTLDLNPATKPDIVGPAYPLDLPDASCEELRAVDVLEHISYRHTDEVLADWARVLEPGGKLYVQVPDAELIMRWFVEEPWRLVERLPPEMPQTPIMGACWRLFGGQDDGLYARGPGEADFNLHRAMFSRASLAAALGRAGLTVFRVETNAHPNLCVIAIRM